MVIRNESKVIATIVYRMAKKNEISKNKDK